MSVSGPTLVKEEQTSNLIRPEDRANYPRITEFMAGIYSDRYLLKQDDEILESVSDMFWRVASTIASAEEPGDQQKYANQFYDIMRSLRFLPGGRTLAAAGTKIGNLANCFVINPEDSLDSILETQKQAATVWSRGGGVGFNFSSLREDRANTTKAQGMASGPVSFMRSYNATAETIQQGGARRAACMGVLSVHHPDIETFIVAKEIEGDLKCFNISVALTHEFMDALARGNKYNRYDYQGNVKGTFSAQETWDLLCKYAWQTADPGIFFVDTANQCDFSEFGKVEATNPCGEQPLLNFESCNLGSIRLDHFVSQYAWEREADGIVMPKGPPDEVARYLWESYVDKEELRRVIVLSTRFLDNVISVTKFPLPEIAEITQRNRKIGLGLMGWADTLLKLGISYKSPVAVALARIVSRYFKDISVAASEELVKEGRSSVQERNAGIELKESQHIPPRRNMWTTSIAPTGTISLAAGTCSWSIEPVFDWLPLRKLRKLKEGSKHTEEVHIVIPNNVYAAFREAFGEEAELPSYFTTAYEVTPEEHVRMMAAFQEHCHSAISKTINLPQETSVEGLGEVFKLAYKLGCKGVTIYRSECRQEQIYYTKEAAKKKQAQQKAMEKFQRPLVLKGETVKVTTNLGSAFITVNKDENTGEPIEVFVTIGKGGSEVSAAAEAVGKLVSLALQTGASIKSIQKRLEGITSTPVWSHGIQVKSLWDAVARVLVDNYEPTPEPIQPNGNGASSPDEEALEVVQPFVEKVSLEEETLCKECG